MCWDYQTDSICSIYSMRKILSQKEEVKEKRKKKENDVRKGKRKK